MLPIETRCAHCALLHLSRPAAAAGRQYGEFRTGFNGDKEDTRMVVWGLRYILENYVMRQWTEEEVERAALFYRCVCCVWCCTGAAAKQGGLTAEAAEQSIGVPASMPLRLV